MSQLTSIADALSFVEEHLKEEIGVSDMAEAAAYSLYHFSRVFNGLVHHSPYDYLIRRRLSESMHWLADTDRRIVDVAFEYQFGTHETFSRAFKRMVGVPPSAYRQQCAEAGGIVHPPCYLPPLTAAYLEHINQNGILRPEPVEQPSIHVVGLMSWVDGPSAVSDLWDALEWAARSLDRPPEAEAFYGVVWYPQIRRGDGSSYYLAGFVDSVPGPPGAGQPSFHPGLVAKLLPAMACARFVHRGSRSQLAFTHGYIYHTWFPHASWDRAFPLEIERGSGGHRPLADGSCECEILVPIRSAPPQ